MHGLPDYNNISQIDSESIEVVWNSILKELYVNFEVPEDKYYYIPKDKTFSVLYSLKCYNRMIIKGKVIIFS